MEIITINGKMEVDRYPNECPFCHKSIIPLPISGIQNDRDLQAVFFCPDIVCRKLFIGYYRMWSKWQYEYSSVGTSIGRAFPDSINKVSENFSIIYNQAYIAEQYNLKEICGVGYRKALEFLIKDYLVSIIETEKDEILGMNLAKCIETYVSNTSLKAVAKRAVWLGNDETHYLRVWVDKDLSDLKRLIDLTVHWIEMDYLTSSILIEMPDKRKPEKKA